METQKADCLLVGLLSAERSLAGTADTSFGSRKRVQFRRATKPELGGSQAVSPSRPCCCRSHLHGHLCLLDSMLKLLPREEAVERGQERAPRAVVNAQCAAQHLAAELCAIHLRGGQGW